MLGYTEFISVHFPGSAELCIFTEVSVSSKETKGYIHVCGDLQFNYCTFKSNSPI